MWETTEGMFTEIYADYPVKLLQDDAELGFETPVCGDTLAEVRRRR